MMNGPSVWKCSREEWDAWAVVLDDDRQLRAATFQELLNRSVVVADIDATSVVFHVGKVRWKYGDFPGSPVAAGDLRERTRALTPGMRGRVLRERVIRRARPGRPELATVEVKAADVQPEDIMDTPPYFPVTWAGERL